MDTQLYEQISLIAALAIAVGWSKDVEKDKKLIAKKKLAHAVGDVGLAISAYAILALIPGLPFPAILGIAMLLVIFGKDFVKAKLDKYLDKKVE